MVIIIKPTPLLSKGHMADVNDCDDGDPTTWLGQDSSLVQYYWQCGYRFGKEGNLTKEKFKSHYHLTLCAVPAGAY